MHRAAVCEAPLRVGRLDSKKASLLVLLSVSKCVAAHVCVPAVLAGRVDGFTERICPGVYSPRRCIVCLPRCGSVCTHCAETHNVSALRQALLASVFNVFYLMERGHCLGTLAIVWTYLGLLCCGWT